MPAQRRTKTIPIRVSPAEHAAAEARHGRGKVSEAARDLLLHGAVMQIDTAARDLAAEKRREGNSLTEIAEILNLAQKRNNLDDRLLELVYGELTRIGRDK